MSSNWYINGKIGKEDKCKLKMWMSTFEKKKKLVFTIKKNVAIEISGKNLRKKNMF